MAAWKRFGWATISSPAFHSGIPGAADAAMAGRKLTRFASSGSTSVTTV